MRSPQDLREALEPRNQNAARTMLLRSAGGERRVAREVLSRQLSQVVRAAASILGVGLVAFHLWLFWTRALAGELLDPARALTWSAAGLLLGALLALRRMGIPVLWGRKAAVFWLLVALLHWSAARSIPSEPTVADVQGLDWVLALPAAVAPLALALALRWARRNARPRAPVLAPRFAWLALDVGAARRAGWLLQLSPRPPPA